MINWIKEILGITKLETDNLIITEKHNEAIGLLEKSKLELRRVNKLLQDTIALEQRLQLGVDVHCNKHEKSWAVVVIEGKPNYVKFIDLNRGDAQEIRSILRRFSKGRFTVDSFPMIDPDYFIQF